MKNVNDDNPWNYLAKYLQCIQVTLSIKSLLQYVREISDLATSQTQS